MKAWESFLLELEKSLGKETIAQWLRPLKITKYDACNLYLEGDAFQLAWFEEQIRPFLKGFTNTNHKLIKVHLTVAEKENVKKFFSKNPLSIHSDALHPHLTLPLFVETEQNRVAFRLLCELIGYDPQKNISLPYSLSSFNPLYLYGGKGVGKTHLLMGSAHLLREKKINAFFVNAEKFTEHVVHAIRLGKMEEFRKAYRTIDVLLIDDVHILARKAATQEEFFHTFNALHTLGKQIILSAYLAPSELTDIEPRLISRFEWGLSLQLTPILREELFHILLMKKKAFNLFLDEDSTQFLMEHFPNPKDLAIAIESIALRQNLTHASLKECLKELFHKKETEEISPQKIAKMVSEYFGLKFSDLLGKAQSREISFPRQLAMYICRNRLKLTLSKIGELFGRDHSTVITSIKQIEKAIATKNEEALQTLSEIERLLQNR